MNKGKLYLKTLKGKINQQKGKLNLRLKNKDFDGAITASKTFLEGVFEDIHVILLGQKINNKSNDLRDKYKFIKKLLRLDPSRQADEKLKSICSNISSLVSNIEDISNIEGDRHFTEIIPKKYLASFVVKISLTFSDFLYQRLKFLYKEYHPKKMNLIYERLVKILDSPKRAYSKKSLLEDQNISQLLSIFESDPYAIRILINKFISDFEIENYRRNDIFFAAMRLFFKHLEKDKIKAIFLKCKDNGQTFPPFGHLVSFLFAVKNLKPNDFLEEEMEIFINKLSSEDRKKELKKFKYMFNIE